jgi:hypothetical protein
MMLERKSTACLPSAGLCDKTVRHGRSIMAIHCCSQSILGRKVGVHELAFHPSADVELHTGTEICTVWRWVGSNMI